MNLNHPVIWCLSPALFILAIVALALMAAVVDVRRNDPRRKTTTYPHHKGDMVGYKVLKWNEDMQRWESPMEGSPWIDGRLIANRKPTRENEAGIYVGKTPESVSKYLGGYNCRLFLVGMKLPIVEHEAGYRAYKAYQIKEA